MSTYVKPSTGAKNAVLDNGFGATFNDGVIYIYSGAMPSDPNGAETGAHIGTVTVNGGDFVFGTPDAGLGWDATVGGKKTKAAAETWILKGNAAAGTGTEAGYAVLYPNAPGHTGADPGDESRIRIFLAIGTSAGFLRMADRRIQDGGLYTVNSCEFNWAD